MISDVTLNLLLHHIIVLIQDWITLVILYFKENLLKLASACQGNKKIINLYITFETKSQSYFVGNSMLLRNSLFWAVKLTKNADPDINFYSRCGISFDVRGTFSLPNGEFGKNVIIFSADMS